MKDPTTEAWRTRIESSLKNFFVEKGSSSKPLLNQAMEYSVIAGGKRVRPLLVMMACEAAGEDPIPFIDMALAPELLHTYSLIHDDLPCMDNDDLRRGKPTNHKVFGESLAILAGDGLHSESFQILVCDGPKHLKSETRVLLVKEFCHAIGRLGMVSGQVLDLEAEKSTIAMEQLKLLHSRKTGALIRFCARMGGILAQASPQDLQSLTAYSENLGLLFQVVDDLLDRKSNKQDLGKTPGKDLTQGKATFPKLIGMEETELLANQLLENCLHILTNSNLKRERLRHLAEFIRERAY